MAEIGLREDRFGKIGRGEQGMGEWRWKEKETKIEDQY